MEKQQLAGGPWFLMLGMLLLLLRPAHPSSEQCEVLPSCLGFGQDPAARHHGRSNVACDASWQCQRAHSDCQEPQIVPAKNFLEAQHGGQLQVPPKCF